ncbi:DNA polymerase II large subunit [Candidatus Bathyarchaeota archaeon]|nr:DNA polymerase II large subunit [Candidatus Bathyarchaeota archaeon]
MVEYSELYSEYFSKLEGELRKAFSIASIARSRGMDPSLEVEVKLAEDMAERVELLVGPPGIASYIRRLKNTMSREALAFKAAEDIVSGILGSFKPEEAAEKALRTALAILTEAVTVAPVQGITKVSIKRNFDGTSYLSVYFAGPIRPAGGTEQGLIVVVADHIRRKLGLEAYKPTEEEVNRFIEEVRLYEREVRPFQYRVPDEVLRRAIENLPVEVTGVETDPVEVSYYRDLPRIETNRVRGGALIVVNDGLIGRHRKIARVVKELGIDGWDWLENLWEAEGGDKSLIFLDEVIAGRPVFSSPSAYGGFRVRYGRSRNTGLAAVGLHPSTLYILDEFLAVGTQIKLERPGKGGIVAVVDSIEPPIVKLKNGDVVRLDKPPSEDILRNVDRILFLGDILLSFYEFLENKHTLLPANFTEEEWAEDLRARIAELGFLDIGIPAERINRILANPLSEYPTVQEALKISKVYGIPLHPRYVYSWDRISSSELYALRLWLQSGYIRSDRIEAPYNSQFKAILERVWIPHKIREGRIIIEGGDAEALVTTLQLGSDVEVDLEMRDGLSVLSKILGIPMRSKAVSFIGARMGRPEKAKPREMKPPVHVLFPVGLYGGSKRDIIEASTKKSISVEVVDRRCTVCGRLSFTTVCTRCKAPTRITYRCPKCRREYTEKRICDVCGSQTMGWSLQIVPLREILDEAKTRIGYTSLKILKGVRSLLSEDRIPEILEKGIIRARYNVTIFKDGTIRFDSTNAPLTHFKPVEINVSVEDLRRLGYTVDIYGKPLINEDQLCELKIHDIIIGFDGAYYLEKVAKFVDEELEKIYGLEPYYRLRSYRDLVGHLVVGLAPHTSVGVLGRIIGFTEASVCFAHPYWHAAKRRDCDGDEDSIMLLLDCLLNFSRHYLPSKMGGLMDAPLFLTYRIDPTEVDSAVHNLDIAEKYPLEFYDLASKMADPKEALKYVEVVSHRLNSKMQFEGFRYTHETSHITCGPKSSRYKRLRTMYDKVKAQIDMVERIEAVEARIVVEKVLETHLVKDLAGNIKAFVSQQFRCKRCNSKYRRIPLKGVCIRCGGELTLTVHPSSVEKYLRLAEDISKRYPVDPYIKERVKLLSEEISSLLHEARSDNGKGRMRLSDFM